MRNDARPVGEAFQDIAEHDRQESRPLPADKGSPAGQAREPNKPFVAKRDPGDDEELPSDASDR